MLKKMIKLLIGSSMLLCGFVITTNAATPTFPNNARFTRGVGNTCFWVSSSASSYASNIRYAANKWESTGWDNPIYMTEVGTNYATHIDVYAKTPAEDLTLGGTTAAYVSFWDSSSNLVARRGFVPSVNYFYTEITINNNQFPSSYRNSILIHEMGHAFGLAHTSNRYSIMYPYYDQVLVSTVQKTDNDAINYLY